MNKLYIGTNIALFKTNDPDRNISVSFLKQPARTQDNFVIYGKIVDLLLFEANQCKMWTKQLFQTQNQ